MIELEGASSRARTLQDCGRSAPSTRAILLSQVFQGDGDGVDNHTVMVMAMVLIVTQSW